MTLSTAMSSHPHNLSKAKKAERKIRAAHRRNKRQNRKNRDGDDEGTGGDFVSLRTQLECMGLTLREVTGDG